jgi:chemotaxis protein MotA
MIDRATLLGTAVALALVIGVACDGGAGGLAALWQTPSALLVAGGAVFTTLAATPGAKFRALGGVLRNAFMVRTREPEELIVTLVGLAHTARREGLLALEKPVELLEDGFLKRTLRMAVDGVDARTIEQVCQTELESTDLRHACGSGLLESMGRAAPVFGMIGTLIGLVFMLGRMDDPSRIGPGMAVALLTTLYGMVLAHVFCLPLARKLTHRSSEELLNKTIALAGVLAIQAGDHPRLVEQKLRAYLPAPRGEPVAAPAVEMKPRRRRLGEILRPLAGLRSGERMRAVIQSRKGPTGVEASEKKETGRRRPAGNQEPSGVA